MMIPMKQKSKIIFMGTPDFAVPVFYALINAGHDVCAIVTQPDRPKGRGHNMAFSPVKEAALKEGVPVLQPGRLRGNKEFREVLRGYGADVFVVAAYGMLLSPKILEMPPLGCINVHASLLPKYRGASPIHHALLNGDDKTGVTIMYMARGLDTGDMILQRELPIGADERFPSLHDRMAALGGECIVEALTQISAGTAERIPQDDAASSYSPMINKQDGHIDWNLPGQRIINMTRALDPWPGPYTVLNGQPLKIWRCEPTDGSYDEKTAAGTVISVDTARGFTVRTGDGALTVTEVQGVGGKRMAARDYIRGHKINVGEVAN
jgi:methionyl-tRNA formyltransferase